MKFRVSTCLFLGTATLAGCSTTPPQQASGADDAKQMAQALQGRVAGPPVNCMPNLHGASRMEVVNDWTILFRDGGTVYVQNPKGGCPGIENGRYTLVLHQVGAHQVCQGDIHQLVDLDTGVRGGACVFGPFVPYRKPS